MRSIFAPALTHGLGVPIPNRATAEEMLYAARLNWDVNKVPIPNVGASAEKKPRRYHLVRMPLADSEPEVPLGVVSSRYRPLQNFEAFRFFDPVIGAEKAAFETAGSLGNGERVWVLAKAPGELRVLR
ncbi:MAG TPA: DUF932 domain-containing protein, partial [Candidatus Methylomirabilis sp.]|nr:DUF932 domain-containing protein [Candidatus Methylomirabilis sp.]